MGLQRVGHDLATFTSLHFMVLFQLAIPLLQLKWWLLLLCPISEGPAWQTQLQLSKPSPTAAFHMVIDFFVLGTLNLWSSMFIAAMRSGYHTAHSIPKETGTNSTGPYHFWVTKLGAEYQTQRCLRVQKRSFLFWYLSNPAFFIKAQQDEMSSVKFIKTVIP